VLRVRTSVHLTAVLAAAFVLAGCGGAAGLSHLAATGTPSVTVPVTPLSSSLTSPATPPTSRHTTLVPTHSPSASSPTPSATATPYCTAGQLVGDVTTDRPSYSAHPVQPVRFTYSVRNASSTPCRQVDNVCQDWVAVTNSAGQRVWANRPPGAGLCQPGPQPIVEPGDILALHLEWSDQRECNTTTNPSCPGPAAPPGTYTAQAHWEIFSNDPHTGDTSISGGTARFRIS
jgi:hypothetical protein